MDKTHTPDDPLSLTTRCQNQTSASLRVPYFTKKTAAHPLEPVQSKFYTTARNQPNMSESIDATPLHAIVWILQIISDQVDDIYEALFHLRRCYINDHPGSATPTYPGPDETEQRNSEDTIFAETHSAISPASSALNLSQPPTNTTPNSSSRPPRIAPEGVLPSPRVIPTNKRIDYWPTRRQSDDIRRFLICYFHRKSADRATSCQLPCAFPHHR